MSAVSFGSFRFVLPLLFTACQSASYGYGYVNQLKQTVAVVEYYRNYVERSTFTPEGKRLPVEGSSLAERVDFVVGGRQIAVFTLDDFKRSLQPEVPPVLIISRSGVRLASRGFWERMALEWDGPGPSHPVSFTGGDGSSIDKAIIVNARTPSDEGFGQNLYMRERFGYMWTYKYSQLYLIVTDDKIYDEIEFVTHDGKKHELYFDTTRLRANQVKTSK